MVQLNIDAVLFTLVAGISAFSLVGCGADKGSDARHTNSGGLSHGGALGDGGDPADTGGSSLTGGNAGAVNTGGNAGATASGGSIAMGGAPADGGAPPSAGALSTGGISSGGSSTAGHPNEGGNAGSAGKPTFGGASSTGGSAGEAGAGGVSSSLCSCDPFIANLGEGGAGGVGDSAQGGAAGATPEGTGGNPPEIPVYYEVWTDPDQADLMTGIVLQHNYTAPYTVTPVQESVLDFVVDSVIMGIRADKVVCGYIDRPANSGSHVVLHLSNGEILNGHFDSTVEISGDIRSVRIRSLDSGIIDARLCFRHAG